MTVRPSRAAAVTASALALATVAWAQEAPDAGPPTAIELARATQHVDRRLAITPGTSVALRTGFVPDPLVVRGEVTPRVPLAPMWEGCLGFSTSAPTQRIRIDTRIGFLRIFAPSEADPPLAVQPPGRLRRRHVPFGSPPPTQGRLPAGLFRVF